VEEGLVEMYLAGLSVRRVEDITEALWGTRVSPSTLTKRAEPEDLRAEFGFSEGERLTAGLTQVCDEVRSSRK
jgi:hypothetical protein